MATDARAAFVERLGGALTSAGVARLPARTFAALLVDEDGRMTAAELAEQLEVSPAAVSGAVKYLDGVGMIRRERERGSRRDIFVVDDDAWHGSMTRRDQIYAPMVSAFERALAELDEEDPAHRRLVLSLEFLRFLLEDLADLESRWATRMRELGLDG